MAVNPAINKKSLAIITNAAQERHCEVNDGHDVTVPVSTFVHDDGWRQFLYSLNTTGAQNET